MIITFLISLTTVGQSNDYDKLKIDAADVNQEVYFLTHDNVTFKLDTMQLKTINPNWIKSIEVIRKEIGEVTTYNPIRIYIKLKRKKVLLKNNRQEQIKN